MYIPKHFEQTDVGIMQALIQKHPLATLVNVTDQELNANHIPLHLAPTPLPFGMLRGHIAKANPLWREYASEKNVLAIFHGPEAYISPSWYASKKVTGKVVPTWNYSVVHAYGLMRIIDDPAWILSQLEILTRQNEEKFAEPWKISDAPKEYTDKLVEAVLGIEIVITKLIGKWKMSQNQPPENRASVIKGLLDHDELSMAESVDYSSRNTE